MQKLSVLLVAALAVGCGTSAEQHAPPHRPTSTGTEVRPRATPPTKKPVQPDPVALRMVFELAPNHASPSQRTAALVTWVRSIRRHKYVRGARDASVVMKNQRIIAEFPAVFPPERKALEASLVRPDTMAIKVVQEARRSRPLPGRDYPKGSTYKPNTFMQRLYSFAWSDPVARREHIRPSSDGWQHDASGEPFFDYFLRAAKRETLATYLASLARKAAAFKPPAGYEIGFEHIDRPQKASFWRTHYLHSKAEISGADIESSQVVFNPATNFPEVLITLTRKGGIRLERLTGQNLGRRLAIIVNDTVISAPVVQAKVGGGRLSITMGGTNAKRAFEEANDLVDQLRRAKPRLPLRLVSSKIVQP